MLTAVVLTATAAVSGSLLAEATSAVVASAGPALFGALGYDLDYVIASGDTDAVINMLGVLGGFLADVLLMVVALAPLFMFAAIIVAVVVDGAFSAFAPYVKAGIIIAGLTLFVLDSSYWVDADSNDADDLYHLTETPPPPPPPTLELISPTPNYQVTGSVYFIATTNPSDVDHVIFQISQSSTDIGSAWTDDTPYGSNPTYWSYDWYSTTVDDGNYLITVTAYDVYGNVLQEASQPFSVYNPPPPPPSGGGGCFNLCRLSIEE